MATQTLEGAISIAGALIAHNRQQLAEPVHMDR